jgi:hypothetical protein
MIPEMSIFVAAIFLFRNRTRGAMSLSREMILMNRCFPLQLALRVRLRTRLAPPGQ